MSRPASTSSRSVFQKAWARASAVAIIPWENHPLGKGRPTGAGYGRHTDVQAKGLQGPYGGLPTVDVHMIRLCLKSQRARRARGGELCSKAFEADVAAATAMQNNAAAEIIRPRAVREEVSNRAWCRGRRAERHSGRPQRSGSPAVARPSLEGSGGGIPVETGACQSRVPIRA